MKALAIPVRCAHATRGIPCKSAIKLKLPQPAQQSLQCIPLPVADLQQQPSARPKRRLRLRNHPPINIESLRTCKERRTRLVVAHLLF